MALRILTAGLLFASTIVLAGCCHTRNANRPPPCPPQCAPAPCGPNCPPGTVPPPPGYIPPPPPIPVR